MDQITKSHFAHLDGIEKMMAGDYLKTSMDMFPSPTPGDEFIWFEILQEGGCDVPERPQVCLLSDFHSSISSAISQNCLGRQSLPVQGTLLKPFHSSTGLH